jgi:poly(3-hydroxyalkanoate) synthetase
VAGTTITPATLRLPCFAAIPGRDRIVPPESAASLASAIPGTVTIQPKAGHIGMVAGRSADKELWTPFAEWALRVPKRAARFRKSPARTKVSP